jgi:phage repressor protein C with HTH and peptisase S24 domain
LVRKTRLVLAGRKGFHQNAPSQTLIEAWRLKADRVKHTSSATSPARFFSGQSSSCAYRYRDHARLPANLGGVRSACAIYMVGDSMEPRYEPGWLLHVNPFKPPTRGRDVVVYKADNSVLIKQLVGWESDTLVLHRLNPTDTLRIPRAEVRECHLVVGADQEG